MKKYVKPALYYESFELSQNITACGFDMNSTESALCQAYGDKDFGWDGLVLLRDWCQDPIDGEWGGMICYENGSAIWDEGYRIFNS